MVSAAQIPAALVTVDTLRQELTSLTVLLNQANNLINAGWVINIGTASSPINIPVTPAQQAALVTLYDALKASLVTTFQQLP